LQTLESSSQEMSHLALAQNYRPSSTRLIIDQGEKGGKATSMRQDPAHGGLTSFREGILWGQRKTVDARALCEAYCASINSWNNGGCKSMHLA
jgi:hypothetical protein